MDLYIHMAIALLGEVFAYTVLDQRHILLCSWLGMSLARESEDEGRA